MPNEEIHSFSHYLKQKKVRTPVGERYKDFVVSREEYLKTLEDKKEEQTKEEE